MFKKSLVRMFALALVLPLAGAMAFAQQTRTLNGGFTTVTLSSSFVSALNTLGVTTGTVNPSELEGGMVSFPVVGGALDLSSAAGNILHSGGLTLTAGSTVVTLQSFIIDTTSTPEITGLVSVNGKLVGRLPLFDIMLPPGFTTPLMPTGIMLQLKHVSLTLDFQAAKALDGAFGIGTTLEGSYPSAPVSIGTANVVMFLATKKGHGPFYGSYSGRY